MKARQTNWTNLCPQNNLHTLGPTTIYGKTELLCFSWSDRGFGWILWSIAAYYITLIIGGKSSKSSTCSAKGSTDMQRFKYRPVSALSLASLPLPLGALPPPARVPRRFHRPLELTVNTASRWRPPLLLPPIDILVACWGLPSAQPLSGTHHRLRTKTSI